jgi:selenoprotein W-related protein
LAGEIQENLKITPELVKLSGGIFEVYVDNELIFSKKALGRFPEPGEVMGKLKQKIR